MSWSSNLASISSGLCSGKVLNLYVQGHEFKPPREEQALGKASHYALAMGAAQWLPLAKAQSKFHSNIICIHAHDHWRPMGSNYKWYILAVRVDWRTGIPKCWVTANFTWIYYWFTRTYFELLLIKKVHEKLSVANIYYNTKTTHFSGSFSNSWN